MYTFKIDSNTTYGRLNVSYLGITGHICSAFWDDNDAKVFCKSVGYGTGIAYHHFANKVRPIQGSKASDGTYVPNLLNQFNCTGDESSLMDCTYLDRLTLGSCSGSYDAGVMCMKDENSSKYSLHFIIKYTNSHRLTILVKIHRLVSFF